MFPVLHRFYRLSTKDELTTFLFARLLNNELQLVHDDKAYTSTLDACSLQGAIDPVTSDFLCFLLSNPKTEAHLKVNSNDITILELRLIDVQSVTLCLTAALTKALAAPLLHAMIMSLSVGLSGLESLLLSIGNKMIPEYDLASNMTLQKLSDLCAPLMHEGNLVEDSPYFRKGVSNDMGVVATRALVIASQAAQVREDVVACQRARAAEERDRLVEVERMLRETKKRAKQITKKKDTVCLFDDTSPASEERRFESPMSSLGTQKEDSPDIVKHSNNIDPNTTQEHKSDKDFSLKDEKPIDVAVQPSNSEDQGNSSKPIVMNNVPTAKTQPKKKKRKIARIV